MFRRPPVWYAGTSLSGVFFSFLNRFIHALEKEMATYSSVLAWKIPGTGEPGGLLSGVAQSRTRLKRQQQPQHDEYRV